MTHVTLPEHVHRLYSTTPWCQWGIEACCKCGNGPQVIPFIISYRNKGAQCNPWKSDTAQ